PAMPAATHRAPAGSLPGRLAAVLSPATRPRSPIAAAGRSDPVRPTGLPWTGSDPPPLFAASCALPIPGPPDTSAPLRAAENVRAGRYSASTTPEFLRKTAVVPRPARRAARQT